MSTSYTITGAHAQRIAERDQIPIDDDIIRVEFAGYFVNADGLRVSESDASGYHPGDYFTHQGGTYLGPDCGGIEPAWVPAGPAEDWRVGYRHRDPQFAGSSQSAIQLALDEAKAQGLTAPVVIEGGSGEEWFIYEGQASADRDETGAYAFASVDRTDRYEV